MYDFRKQAGLRNLIGNYEAAIRTVEAEYKAGLRAAGDEPLRVAGDQIQKLSGLLMTPNRSYITKEGNSIRGAISLLDLGPEFNEDQVQQFVQKATGIRCNVERGSSNQWVCTFQVG